MILSHSVMWKNPRPCPRGSSTCAEFTHPTRNAVREETVGCWEVAGAATLLPWICWICCRNIAGVSLPWDLWNGRGLLSKYYYYLASKNLFPKMVNEILQRAYISCQIWGITSVGVYDFLARLRAMRIPIGSSSPLLCSCLEYNY